ncbi:acyl-CoA thioesterase/BAAT N-terminal domain-containing protein [Clostridium sp. SHJSY1]|uniref:acyl-CoA thioesterase/bile acid-CoA:amino acid N-acyltransferase family protein n=1 Tax=Clostridium sp. SHJSY1 TaxID=2942483 RepID=UPI00287664DD|nr:acyl-CoA thioester hydrolase/BAAT C-terminal domain-containing protein [Clostridium sp. SHJSY1]MDS0525253.1 acyl-CoA thioesterase/BAAT N-terminal domain-containing protein [Clostridium sp. SHJSY1]
MKIEISKKEALADEKLKIRITELKSNSKLRISMKMELPWCIGEEYSSYGIFLSDEKGEVDLNLAKPIEGTYESNNSMGLIYSMKKSKSEGKNISENISIEKPIIINMLFESSDEKEEITLKRLFKTEDVIIKDICEKDFSGKLFYKKKSKQKTILMLGGSDGNINAVTLMAAPLASRGFNVLVVPYFNYEGLHERLEKIPLEYFEKIFEWIKNNEITKSEYIFIHGTSKGGELALLLASRYKEVKKVVAVEPHAYCFQALDRMNTGKNVSSWEYKGESIPYIKIDDSIAFQDLKKSQKEGTTFGFANAYKKSVEKAENKEEARIKLENSESDILMIAGADDNMWNSYDGCLEILDKLKNSNYKHKVELVTCKKMGHPMPIPYIIPISENLFRHMMGGVFTSGGTIEGNAEGQYKSWKRMIEFFNETI